MKTKTNLDIQQVDINSPTLDPANARTGHDINGLAQSLDRYGLRKPIVVNKRTNIVLAGNGTLKAARQLGWSEIAVNYVDDDPQTAVGYALADNRLTDLSEFDNEALLLSLQQFDSMDDVIGFEQADYDELLAELGVDLDEDLIEDSPPPIDKAEELQQIWNVQEGDLWALGRHRLLCGDCTDKATVDRLMDGERADLMVTDPPYGVSYADKNRFLNSVAFGKRIQEPIQNDHLTIEETAEKVWKPAFVNAHNILADVSSFYCFCPGGIQMLSIMKSIDEAQLIPRHELIWLKNNHVLGRTDYAYKHEPIIYGWKRKGTHKYYGGFQTSILEFNKPNASKLHPTMKPIELIAKLITNSSKINQIIYDPFLGSGTTLIASHQTNRICYGTEISPKYCAVILQRYADLTNETPTKIS